jgi:hypothetical protein
VAVTDISASTNKNAQKKERVLKIKNLKIKFGTIWAV